LLRYFYDYVEKAYSTENIIEIKWISFYELWISDLWFNEGEIKLKMYFWNKKTMVNFIKFLIDKNSDYLFFIDEFSYPNFWTKILEEKWFNMTINLKIYYK
jgi:hypothetical protein